MLNPRLAGRYAKSLMDLAIERNQLDEVYRDMLFLHRLCQISRELVSLLRSPVIRSDQKQKVLDALTKNQIGPLTAGFNRLLINKGREAFLPEIITAFIQQFKDHRGIYMVKLTTAVPVSESLKKEIINKLKSGSVMQQIELNTEVKENIIGGFVLEVGDKLVDASVAYELHNAKKEFENNDFVYKIR